MTKVCKVLLNNGAVTVVRFGERDVQLPPIGRKADFVTVRFENGRYEAVAENKAFQKPEAAEEIEAEETPRARKPRRRKPVEEVEQ